MKMKGFPDSLQAMALAQVIVDRATIADANMIIRACKVAIEERIRKRRDDVHAYAKTLIPGLLSANVVDEGHSARGMHVVYQFAAYGHNNVYWEADGKVPYSMTGDAPTCPEFTLETHAKIVKFIKSY